jgi:hypothetical protein
VAGQVTQPGGHEHLLERGVGQRRSQRTEASGRRRWTERGPPRTGAQAPGEAVLDGEDDIGPGLGLHEQRQADRD